MRVLIIEDEEKIRNFLKKSLESECYAVDAAEDGENGLYLAEINSYDAIILDINLPKKSGMEICRTLRSEGNTVPILIISVYSEIETKVDLLNVGADDYLLKPFSVEELKARVRALLRRPQKEGGNKLEIDNLILDTERHIVSRGKNEIRLTRKEFALLEYLMRNIGIVLSRSMIMEHVWDVSVDPFSNMIESHIMSLRKKIDLPAEKKLIHTVCGRGYKME